MEAGGVAGVVEDVQVFATIILTVDNKEITVPNGTITGSSIVNYSAKSTRRVDMVFGIGYDDNIKQAKQILEDVVSADPRVLEEEIPDAYGCFHVSESYWDLMEVDDLCTVD